MRKTLGVYQMTTVAAIAVMLCATAMIDPKTAAALWEKMNAMVWVSLMIAAAGGARRDLRMQTQREQANEYMATRAALLAPAALLGTFMYRWTNAIYAGSEHFVGEELLTLIAIAAASNALWLIRKRA